MSAATKTSHPAPHIPVLLRPIIKAVSPLSGVWLDGTFGAGSYTRALLDSGADKVIAVDRDPLAFEMASCTLGSGRLCGLNAFVGPRRIASRLGCEIAMK